MATPNISGAIQQGLQIRSLIDERKIRQQQAAGLTLKSQQQQQQFGLEQQLRQQELQTGQLGLQKSQLGLKQEQFGFSQAQRQDAQQQQTERLTSIARGAEAALSLTGQDRQTFLTNRLSELQAQGKATESTQDAINIGNEFGFDSPELQSALQQGLATANSFGVFTAQQKIQQAAQAKQTEQLVKSESDIRKEVRGRVGSAVKDISKAASTVTENAGKLTGLVSEIKKGNRSAVAQALVSLVKLGDPTSIVKETEMEAALNAPNPIASLTGIGVETSAIESIIRKIDPLNPTAINTDELLSTANALISANVPSIQAQFSEQRQLAGTNLTEKGVKSLFPEAIESRIKGLSDLIKAQPGPKFESTVLGRPVTEQDIKDTLSENPGLTREDLFKQLGIQ